MRVKPLRPQNTIVSTNFDVDLPQLLTANLSINLQRSKQYEFLYLEQTEPNYTVISHHESKSINKQRLLEAVDEELKVELAIQCMELTIHIIKRIVNVI
jgi:hypothetical protein